MQKTAVSIIIATLLSLLLLGCRQEEGVGTVTAVAVATIPPTATSSPTVVVVETAVATATTTSSNITPEPTLRPSETPIAIPTLNVSELDQRFRLQRPVADMIVESLIQGLRVDSSVWSPNGGNLSTRSWLINSLINHDLEIYYEDGFPNAQNLISENPLVSYRAYYNSPRPVKILEDGFLQYLNEQNKDLESIRQIDGILSFSIQEIELGEPISKAWLVTVDFEAYHVRDLILIEQSENSSYEQMSNNLPNFSSRYYEDGESQGIVTYDLTGDGINEIVIQNEAYLGGNATDQMLNIYTWTGERLEKLESLDLHYYDSYYFAPKYEFGDFIHDTTTDIRIAQQRALNFGCAWEEVNIYSWNGLQPQHELADGTPKDIAVCNLWRSVAGANRTYSIPEDEILGFLELAINQLREEPSAELDWLAFALFQSAIINVRDGNFQQAKQNIDDIHTLENSPYAQFIVENDQETDESRFISLCRNLVINSDQALETNIGEFLDEQAIRGRGFDWELADRSIICNLENLSKSILSQSSLPSEQLPTEIANNLGLVLDLMQSNDFDQDGELEWIGILEPEDPTLVIFDEVNGFWEVKYLDSPFYFPILDIEFQQGNVVGDDQSELLITLTEDSTRYYAPEEVNYSVYLVDISNGEYEIIRNIDAYDEKPALNNLDAGFFGLDVDETEQTNWRLLEGFGVEAEYMSSYVWDLTNAVLTQANPDIASKITDLLNYLPSDDPEAQPYREHLTYLLGYHYELIGDEETAVSTYLDLIQQNPSSPWSWLAWARLQPE